jgi:hypothetical protein
MIVITEFYYSIVTSIHELGYWMTSSDLCRSFPSLKTEKSMLGIPERSSLLVQTVIGFLKKILVKLELIFCIMLKSKNFFQKVRPFFKNLALFIKLELSSENPCFFASKLGSFINSCPKLQGPDSKNFLN